MQPTPNLKHPLSADGRLKQAFPVDDDVDLDTMAFDEGESENKLTHPY